MRIRVVKKCIQYSGENNARNLSKWGANVQSKEEELQRNNYEGQLVNELAPFGTKALNGSRMFTLQGRDCGVGGCVALMRTHDGGGVSDQNGW